MRACVREGMTGRKILGGFRQFLGFDSKWLDRGCLLIGEL